MLKNKSKKEFFQRSRKKFLKNLTAAFAGFLVLPQHILAAGTKEIFPTGGAASDDKTFLFQSDYIKIGLSKKKLQFTFFSTDSLGKSQFETNVLLENESIINNNKYRSLIDGQSISYLLEHSETAPWKVTCTDKDIKFQTREIANTSVGSFEIMFSQKKSYGTVLGKMAGKNEVEFPCVLHLPGMGTFRLHCSDPEVKLYYDASRDVERPFIKVALKAADSKHNTITYRFESVAIFPENEKVGNDSRFDGYKKNFINMLQLNPRIRVLANNSASDACVLSLYTYTELARHTPELAEGLTALDLIRQTLDRYLDGMLSYGQAGYTDSYKYDSSDSAPSFIISACYYILETKDYDWAAINYEGIKKWYLKMINTDKNGNGLIEFGMSGNANSWNNYYRPANWMDCIGFGHEDAYSNALAYKACSMLSEVASKLGKENNQHEFALFAEKLRSNYYKQFFNPETGVLGGWRSEDGKLHDYYFTFVNSVAICYGLVEEEKGKEILIRLLEKMREVGYTNFKYGLPGNLIPIRREDYIHEGRRWGWGKDEEGRDGFQIYENGGATGAFVYFFLKALYLYGMNEEANAILLPLLESYKNREFEGVDPNTGMTYDWKAWDGEAWGYEGFLVDNYLPLLSVLDYLSVER